MPARQQPVNRKQRRRTAKAAKRSRGHAPLSGELSREIDLAVGLYRARRFAGAEEVCRRVLAARPTHPGTLSLLGTALSAAGRLDEAIASHRKAIESKPDYAEAHGNLGNALCVRGDTAAGIQSYRRALRFGPDSTITHYNLGRALKSQGKLREAVESYKQALKIRPAYPAAENDLGSALRAQGLLGEAAAAYRRAIALDPDYANAHINLGGVLLAQGELDEAAKAYQRALALDPGHATAHNNLGFIHEKQGNLDQALACYRRAIELDPDIADVHTNLGNALYDKREYEAAVAAHERAIALKPDLAVAHYNLGNALKAISTTEAAIASYRKAIALAPEFAEAYCNLGDALQERGDDEAAIACYEKAVTLGHGFAIGYNLLLAAKKITLEDPIIERIEHRIAAPAAPPADRAAMLLGLANVYDAAGDYATAFATASRANDMIRDAAGFSSDDNDHLKERIIRLFPKEIFSKKNGYGNDSTLPIFIVGMPRAGKTLVEQLLTAHPLVRGAHENNGFTFTLLHLKEWLASRLPYPECMDRLTPDEGRRLGSEYIESLRKHWPDARYLTITHPFNYHYLGLIQLVLPQARIIHCIRDPLDTCLRCYFKNFTALQYTADLTELGDYYLSYKRLMDHWRAVLPRPILEVEFERLVGDPVTVGQEIYAYCGLQPDATDGSSEHTDIFRVLAGLGESETGRWRHYAEYLAPLRKKFADAASAGGEPSTSDKR